MLEAKFGIPVFINNDGDLFVYGEAIAGLLPYVNGLLKKAGSPKRYRNLFGVTLGTGFGGGIVRDGELFTGDNSMAGEVWLLRSKLLPECNAEESASIRAVRRTYAEKAGIAFDKVPEPKSCSTSAPARRAATAQRPGSFPPARRICGRRHGPGPHFDRRPGGDRRWSLGLLAAVSAGTGEGIEQRLYGAERLKVPSPGANRL